MSYSAHVLAQLPQLYIPWTEPSGALFADLSGFGHTARPASGVVTAGGIDGAIRGQRGALWNATFTDFDNVATLPCRLNFTWVLWARFSLTQRTTMRLGVYQNADFIATHTLMAMDNNPEIVPYSWQFETIGPAANGFSTIVVNNATLACWHQFAVTWDGTNLKQYFDGVVVTPTGFSAPTPSIWNAPLIPDTMQVSQLGGSLGVNHLAMYAHAFDASDVAADYGAATPLNTCRPPIVRLTINTD